MTGDPLVPIGDGHTPLSEDELSGLRLSYVSTRGELNEAEQANIAAALARRRVPALSELLDDKYLRDLHRDMFGQVWDGAGRYRTRELNIGIDPTGVAVAVRDLVADTEVRIEANVEPIDEAGARFHHRLVQIHPFVNGNGRHGRAAADLLLRVLNVETFSWGARLDVDTAVLRHRYIDALHAADAGDLAALVAFVRT